MLQEQHYWSFTIFLAIGFSIRTLFLDACICTTLGTSFRISTSLNLCYLSTRIIHSDLIKAGTLPFLGIITILIRVVLQGQQLSSEGEPRQ